MPAPDGVKLLAENKKKAFLKWKRSGRDEDMLLKENSRNQRGTLGRIHQEYGKRFIRLTAKSLEITTEQEGGCQRN